LILFLILKPKHSSDKCAWAYSDWGDCDSTGNKTRNVNCKNNKGPCSDDNCKDTKPTDISQSCTGSDTCSWTYSDWGDCDSSGNQTRTRTSCKNTSGIVCADTTKCGTPILSQSCTSPDTCSWTYSDWSVCTDTTHNQTRTVTCQNTSGTCDTSKCTGTQDAITRPCVLSCCDKTQNPWTCNPASSICQKGQTPTYDCSSCTNNIFPDNVYIFTQTDADSPSDMQTKINKAFVTQGGVVPENNGQNSLYNYAFLFMPGRYKVDIPIGYYTHVAGLGKTRDLVTMIGGPVVNNGSKSALVGALNTFWRSCENMTVNPTNNTMIYAVSQACSLRSVNINGNLQLSAFADEGGIGFSSGGFMANCKIDGILDMSSQQQFICRNTDYGTFPHVLWNNVNIGCTSSTKPRSGCCITTPHTAVGSSTNLTVVNITPSVKEKPYLAYTGPANATDKNTITQYISIMRPNLIKNISGIDVKEPNNSTSSSNYFIISPKSDTTSDSGTLINQILLDSKINCIIFSPGRYTITTPIILSGQLLFGLGVPVLRSGSRNNIIEGYGELCGIIFEAGSGGKGTNILVNLTTKDKPSYLWDISCRVGGGDNKKSSDIYNIDTMLYVGGDKSILDNVWCWVADHYSNNGAVTWDNAICDTGVHVTGDSVIAYGLFAEHTHNRNVYWEGDKGEVYMFQSEFNYYPPNQEQFNEKVAYEIASTVKDHKLYGAGAYSYFPDNPIMADAGFRWTDQTKVDYQNLVTVFLNGKGGINHIYNSTGIPVQYKEDAKGKPLGTQIAIACNGNKDSCSCYPECADGYTCDQTMYRCKPLNGCVAPTPCGDRVNKWLCPPDIGCYSEDGAKKQCGTNACMSW